MEADIHDVEIVEDRTATATRPSLAPLARLGGGRVSMKPRGGRTSARKFWRM
jgi:hypothetical protein